MANLETQQLDEIIVGTRRKMVTAGGAALATLAFGSFAQSAQAQAGSKATDTDVLNFALNLEYLEATFYSYVVTGGDIPSSSTGGGPAPTGAPGATPTFQTQQIADMFAAVAHRCPRLGSGRLGRCERDRLFQGADRVVIRP